MIFAKFIDSKNIIRCPRNGYVGKRAISNLNKFFERNPKIASEEGYMELVTAETVLSGELCYKIENGKIVEGEMENDN